MTQHLKMDKPDDVRLLDKVVQGVLGRPVDRPDGPLKTTGMARYAHEWPFDNLAHGVLVRAPVGKGQVKGVAREHVEASPGVLGVITDDRLLRNPAQGTANEAPVQGWREISYLGQPVALVVAETFEQARHGAQQLVLDIEAEEDIAVDPEAPDTVVDWPDDSQFDQGDIDEALRAAAHTIDEIYRTPGHNSAAMEPHCSIASWEDGRVTLHASYQMLKYNRNELADALGISADKVRILAPYVGGGFGSKLGLAPEAVAAALAAQALDRPVAVEMTRSQVFEATMRRSETRQRVRLAAGADGVLTGIAHENLVSNLPGEEFAEPVAQATHFLYGGEHRRIGLAVARLNRTCAGSVRAPGEAVGTQAIENAMDELAEAAGIDPVELRKRNIPDCHPENGKSYSSRRLADALDAGAERFGWENRSSQPGAVREGEWMIGMGMATAARVNILMESRARVVLEPDATVTVETDMTDIGTGTYAILGQIAGELLGRPLSAVTVHLGDTDFPAAAGAGGSWGASSSGSSVYLACVALRERLAERLGCDPSELELCDGEARSGNRNAPITDLLGGSRFSAEGHIEPGATSEEVEQATFGAHFAEVAVSSVTAEVRVRRMLGVFGAGRILNEKTARSQCYGGMVWGLGLALTEELLVDPRHGHIVNHDFAEYHLPVNLDVPQIDVLLLDERDDWASPIQAKGIGELGICGAAAAVTNAIYNATGIRVRDYPATLDKLLSHLP